MGNKNGDALCHKGRVPLFLGYVMNSIRQSCNI